jgi:hypothetical protein
MKLHYKYTTCGCIASPWLLKCRNVQSYLGENCPYGFLFYIIDILRSSRICPQHLEEELETGLREPSFCKIYMDWRIAFRVFRAEIVSSNAVVNYVFVVSRVIIRHNVVSYLLFSIRQPTCRF